MSVLSIRLTFNMCQLHTTIITIITIIASIIITMITTVITIFTRPVTKKPLLPQTSSTTFYRVALLCTCISLTVPAICIPQGKAGRCGICGILVRYFLFTYLRGITFEGFWVEALLGFGAHIWIPTYASCNARHKGGHDMDDKRKEICAHPVCP